MRSSRPSRAIPRSADNALHDKPHDAKVSLPTMVVGALSTGHGETLPGTNRTTAVSGARPSLRLDVLGRLGEKARHQLRVNLNRDYRSRPWKPRRPGSAGS